MKLYFTTDGSIDQELEQVCPFGELHHFKRDDGSEFTMNKYVGCGGCLECPYCYGAGFWGPYGNKPNRWVLVPQKFTPNSYNYEENEKRKLELGLKQFRIIPNSDYIKCARAFSEDFRNKSKKLKFKIWWWHHIGIKIRDFRVFSLKCYFDLKFKIYDLSYKWFKRV